ncbi:MAG: DHA2 family efflux MFS transporter permease subunit [Phycisphaerae bacterium]|nr:DHA2 family efflux MFS transporter permease subunit [Phycisphaerae bacterium]
MPPGSTTSPPLITHDEQTHPRRWLVLFAMTGSLAMILLDVTVVGVALTTIGEDLGLSHAEKQWVMNGYTLAMASLIALCGRLADSFGRVRSFVLGMLVFTIASAMCGVAQSGLMLVAGRAIQGVGAALMQPASSSIVIGSFAPGERGKAMGVYVGIPMLFLTLGPLIGGALSEYVSWRACFFLNLPIAAGALLLTARVKPHPGPRVRVPVDTSSVLLYLVGLPALVFGIQQGPEWGWATTTVAVPLVIGTIASILFVATERHRSHPLVALRLFDDRGFLGAAVVLFCSQFAMTGQVIFMSDFFQHELGFTQGQAGAALLPMMLPTLFIVHVAGRMYDRSGPRFPILLGTLLATGGLVVQALAAPHLRYLPIAAGMVLFGFGVGLLMSPANTDALSRAGPERRGQASGVLGTTRQVAASTGIAVIGAAVAIRGTAAGHWVAAAAFACAFAAAFVLITGTAPATDARADGADA